MTIQPNAIVARKENLLSQPIDEEIVILNLARDNYIGLDEIGKRIWELLQTRQRVDALCAQLAQEFNATPERIAADVLPFLEEMQREELIEIVA